MSSTLSEVEFLRSELDKMFKRTLALEFENKSLKKELENNRVFAYVQRKETREGTAAVAAGGAGAGAEEEEVFSSSSSVAPEMPWFSSSSAPSSSSSSIAPEMPWFTSSSAPLDFTTPPGTAKAVAVLPPLPKSPKTTVVKDAKEEHRIKDERKRLQALWIEHKVRPEKPISKLLKTLREGLKEAGVAF